MGLWSESAEILVYGTGMVESNYEYIVQIGNPANSGIGFWQMETSDYTDICKWLNLTKNKLLYNSIVSSCYYECLPFDSMALATSIKFAALMCRVHYYRQTQPIPDTAEGLALYHKKFYNSYIGDADVSKNTKIFQEIIDGNL